VVCLRDAALDMVIGQQFQPEIRLHGSR
jgi:hypothetical protein